MTERTKRRMVPVGEYRVDVEALRRARTWQGPEGPGKRWQVPVSRLDPNPFCALWCEELRDLGGREYVVTYRFTSDLSHAAAWCLTHPWEAEPERVPLGSSHLAQDGFLDLRVPTKRRVADSPSDLDAVVRHARQWVMAFGHFMDTGFFPTD